MPEENATSGSITPGNRMAKKMHRGASALSLDGGLDLFADLMRQYNALPDGRDKRDLGCALVPYVKPKLKQIEHSGQINTDIVVRIGGTE